MAIDVMTPPDSMMRSFAFAMESSGLAAYAQDRELPADHQLQKALYESRQSTQQVNLSRRVSTWPAVVRSTWLSIICVAHSSTVWSLHITGLRLVRLFKNAWLLSQSAVAVTRRQRCHMSRSMACTHQHLPT
jgi:hypothetical protein